EELRSKSKICANVFCGAGRECAVTEKGEPTCLCIEQCKPHKRPVCGSNGKTYLNHCELHRDACLTGSKIQVDYDGHCKEKKSVSPSASPVVCYQSNRDELRRRIIQWLEAEIIPDGWFSKGSNYSEILDKYFKNFDNGDSRLDSSEFLKFVEQNETAINITTYPDQENNKLLRGLCVDALIELSDENADWKLSFQEFLKCLNPSFNPPEKKCALEDEVYADGAETEVDCNRCVCACGNWVCTAMTCDGDHSSSSAREQGLMGDECDELTESGFRRWIIRIFCELKEHVLTQCKETRNLERRFNEMLMRMDNLEKNISELMELKNTTRELREACTSFNSRIDQAEERISEVEDQLNEIKREGKMTEKSVKRNEQSLQEIWDYVKRPNLRLIGVPECDEEDESKLENTLQDIIQENFPNVARQANIQVQEIQRTPQRYSSRRATPRHIIVRFTRVEMKEKMLRAAREKVWVTHKGKPIRLTADLSAETLQARREWGPTFNILKEKNFQPRISYPAKLSFISEGKIKFFANKQVLRDYITTRPALQELLKEALHMDGNNQYQPFQKHTKRKESEGAPDPDRGGDGQIHPGAPKASGNS
ncbi:Follistatin-related protein 1, partial [Plecturocebus cupreus]